jgi:hypothetical protein
VVVVVVVVVVGSVAVVEEEKKRREDGRKRQRSEEEDVDEDGGGGGGAAGVECGGLKGRKTGARSRSVVGRLLDAASCAPAPRVIVCRVPPDCARTERKKSGVCAAAWPGDRPFSRALLRAERARREKQKGVPGGLG